MSFTKTISSELYDAEPVFSAALPNAATATSEPFACNGTQLGLELVGTASKNVTVPSGKTLTVKLLASDEKKGTYIEAAQLFQADDETLTAGTELFRFAPVSSLPLWKKVSVTADADLSAGAIAVNLVRKVQK